MSQVGIIFNRRTDEFGDDPSMAFVCPSEVSFDYAGAVVVDFLHRLVRDVNEWYVVQVPLVVVQIRQVFFMV